MHAIVWGILLRELHVVEVLFGSACLCRGQPVWFPGRKPFEPAGFPHQLFQVTRGPCACQRLDPDSAFNILYGASAGR